MTYLDVLTHTLFPEQILSAIIHLDRPAIAKYHENRSR